MLKKGWFGGGLWKPKNPHSLEHLRYLYTLLSKNQVVQDSNRSLLVETLRSIAEILIWGDQNDSSVFDFFLEKNMLSFFLRIMKQKCGSYVCVQLLQTLNILFENIRNETSLYYLLSNNHVNSIIVHKFDFSDEEVMAYYISFLKTLSLKLNSHTIHFFYNEHTNDFPLYTEAIKFFNHPESMVRIAVRTLTLNVYRVDDQSMLQFIRDRTAAPYFSNLVWFIGNHILELDACIRTDIDHSSRDRLTDLVAEHLDHLHYLNDILRLNITELNHVLADHLLNRLLVPLLVYSLNHHHIQDDRPRVSRVVALFLLAQVFLIFSFSPLMQVLARIILHGDNSIFAETSPTLEGPIRLRPGFIAPEESLEQSLQSHSRAGSAYGSQDEFEIESQQSGYSGAESHLSCYEESNLSGYGAAQPSEDEGCEEEKYDLKQDAYSDEGSKSNQVYQEATTEKILLNCRSTAQFFSDDTAVGIQTQQGESNSPTNIGISLNTPTAGISELEATHLNITDEEKEQLKYSDITSSTLGLQSVQEVSLSSRPFIQSSMEALSCTENDYSALFSLCLLYALGHNTGINKELISASLGHRDSETPRIYYNTQLMDCLLRIISQSAQYSSKIRVATLEMALNVLKHMIGIAEALSPSAIVTGSSIGGGSTHTSSQSAFQGSDVNAGYLRDQHLAALEGAKEEATLLLRNFYKGEEIFLDMFEDEWRELYRRPLNVEYLLQDASILLPPAGTPLTGIDFNKRLPCGEVERARRSMRVFFLIRDLCLKIRGEADPHLPLTNPAACVQVSDVLDLNNSDLIACVVITRDGQRTRRFLVIDVIQLILVEPDQRRLGWGVAKFVGFLQDLEVVGDKDDSRVLHITIHRPSAASLVVGRPATPLLAAKFIFDDHIRCMAAKQRLTKGRLKARQRKLHQIARLLEMPTHLQPCPSPPAHALSTMRQEAQRRGSRNSMESRSRNIMHKGKFGHSSRGPGVAFKRDGNHFQDDTSQSSGGTDANLSSSLEPSMRRGSYRSSSRSTSRPRPRSEEIPLANLSPSPGQADSSKVSSPDSPASCEISSRSQTNGCSTGSDNYGTLTLETVVLPSNAIPVFSVPEQVPFHTQVQSGVTAPLCSLLPVGSSLPPGNVTILPVCRVAPSKRSTDTQVLILRSHSSISVTDIEIPGNGIEIFIPRVEGEGEQITPSSHSVDAVAPRNCADETKERSMVTDGMSAPVSADNSALSVSSALNSGQGMSLNCNSVDKGPQESETSFSSKSNCPKKSSSFDFFEVQVTQISAQETSNLRSDLSHHTIGTATSDVRQTSAELPTDLVNLKITPEPRTYDTNYTDKPSNILADVSQCYSVKCESSESSEQNLFEVHSGSALMNASVMETGQLGVVSTNSTSLAADSGTNSNVVTDIVMSSTTGKDDGILPNYTSNFSPIRTWKDRSKGKVHII